MQFILSPLEVSPKPRRTMQAFFHMVTIDIERSWHQTLQRLLLRLRYLLSCIAVCPSCVAKWSELILASYPVVQTLTLKKKKVQSLFDRVSQN